MQSWETKGEEMRKKYESFIESGKLEWHCEGRHGVLRDCSKADYQVLVWFFGNKCGWRKGNDVEFFHMAKVSPPPKKPWGWCGTSVLFEDWHQGVKENVDAVQELRVGDTVGFTHKGEFHNGVVIRKRGQACTVLEGHKQWRVPGHMLERTL